MKIRKIVRPWQNILVMRLGFIANILLIQLILLMEIASLEYLMMTRVLLTVLWALLLNRNELRQRGLHTLNLTM